jgi:hypothetical protein
MYNYQVHEGSLTARFTPEQLASVAAADAELLKLSRVKSDAVLRRAILRHKADAERAIPWMRFVLAMRRQDYRSALSAALGNRQAFFRVAPQIFGAIPRTCLRVVRRGDL